MTDEHAIELVVLPGEPAGYWYDRVRGVWVREVTDAVRYPSREAADAARSALREGGSVPPGFMALVCRVPLSLSPSP